LPGFQFTGASGVQRPFEQPALGLSLNTPYPQGLRGTLTLGITPDNFAADPAVQFSTGGRVVGFTIPANTREAVFPSGAARIQIQTGTVAGAIVIEPAFATETGADLTPAAPPRLRLEVPRAAPALLTGRLSSRSAAQFTIEVTGYSTTRTLSRLEFNLSAADSTAVSASQFSLNVAPEAQVWFQSGASQQLGGQFTVQVPFTLRLDGATGTAPSDLSTLLRGATVRATNELGTSNTVQIAIP
jgi:hypothetical protein